MPASDSDAQRRVLNRLRRANGQLAAVIAAIEDGAPCRDVITQLSAVSSALDRAGFAIISTALKNCLADPAGSEAERGETPEELERLFLMLA